MPVQEVAFGSPDHARTLQLRHDVLRVPLGLSLWDEDLAGEREQRHFGLVLEDGALAACLLAVPLSPEETKLRQMAVAPKFQRQGWGGILIQEVETRLSAEGSRRIILHARRSAELFYAKLGYLPEGPEFTEVGIPHVKMRKTL